MPKIPSSNLSNESLASSHWIDFMNAQRLQDRASRSSRPSKSSRTVSKVQRSSRGEADDQIPSVTTKKSRRKPYSHEEPPLLSSVPRHYRPVIGTMDGQGLTERMQELSKPRENDDESFFSFLEDPRPYKPSSGAADVWKHPKARKRSRDQTDSLRHELLPSNSSLSEKHRAESRFSDAMQRELQEDLEPDSIYPRVVRSKISKYAIYGSGNGDLEGATDMQGEKLEHEYIAKLESSRVAEHAKYGRRDGDKYGPSGDIEMREDVKPQYINIHSKLVAESGSEDADDQSRGMELDPKPSRRRSRDTIAQIRLKLRAELFTNKYKPSKLKEPQLDMDKPSSCHKPEADGVAIESHKAVLLPSTPAPLVVKSESDKQDKHKPSKLKEPQLDLDKPSSGHKPEADGVAIESHKAVLVPSTPVPLVVKSKSDKRERYRLLALRSMMLSMAKGEYNLTEKQRLPGQYICIDCEMVGVGPNGSASALARISMVNYNGWVIMDEYVKPQEPVVDYRTRWSGIRKKDLVNGKPFLEVQKRVNGLLEGRTLIGHAIHNDLEVLLLSHPRNQTRDTQICAHKFKLCKSPHISLKRLAKQELNIDIQTGEHSSVADARATMAIYRLHRTKWESEIQKRRNKPLVIGPPAPLHKVPSLVEKILGMQFGPTPITSKTDKPKGADDRPWWKSLP